MCVCVCEMHHPTRRSRTDERTAVVVARNEISLSRAAVCFVASVRVACARGIALAGPRVRSSPPSVIQVCLS